MQKVRIFVCAHKPVDGIIPNEAYVPLHVGRAISTCQHQMEDYVGDDTGENISKRGHHYSEGTGIYWIWKNVHDSEYVGLTHYRRTFSTVFSNENIDSFFADGTDVIMSKKYARTHSRWHTVLTYMQMEDFLILKSVITKLCPKYLLTLNRFLRDYEDHPFNMVVCRKELYDQYAQWMFGICFEMEKYVRYSGYSNSARVFAYVTELLTPIYFIHNKYKIKEMPVLLGGVEIQHSLRSRMLMHLLHNTVWRIMKDAPIGIDTSFFRGLKQDNIDII